LDFSKVRLFEPKIPELPPPNIPAAVEAAMALVGIDRHGRLTVLVNDPHRHTDSHVVLEELCRRVDASNVRVLVATGTHTFDADARCDFQKRVIGNLPARSFAWHDCLADDLQSVGHWHGHPWLIDELESGLFTVGSVEPHYFAGFTGAHKTVTIGCASRDDIQRSHAAALSPHARPGRLESNPNYHNVVEMLEALEAIRTVGAVNLVQAGERILAAEGGGVISSLHAAAAVAEQVFVHRVDTLADAVIAEVSGPLGANLYQAEKGIKNSEWAVRDGGAIVLVAPCTEGVGPAHFMQLLRAAPTYDQAVAVVEKRGYRLGDHKAVRLRYLTDPRRRAVRAFIVSEGLRHADATAAGFTPVATVAEALTAAGIDPACDSVRRVRDAGNVCFLPPDAIDTAPSRG